VAAEVKRITCPHCGRGMDVGRRAMSVVCPGCNRRIDLQNYHIKTYHAVREMVTCGDVIVEKRGHVVAAVRANNLEVHGRVRGDVRVNERVAVSRTGMITGDIQAPRLRVETGGALNGFVRIGDRGSRPADTLRSA
jgi:hypothetical protein